jgi:hypothetical protein
VSEDAVVLTVRRREAVARQPAKTLDIERATPRPGCLVAVLDVSANGAQVQSERPLRPGSRIHVRVAARNWTLAVAADVVRCSVWLVQADAVIYRGALRFEEACGAVWEEQAQPGEVFAPPP